MSVPAPARWTIVFDSAGLSASDIRMLKAVVDADLRLMQLAEDPSDDPLHEALVLSVARGLSVRFPDVVFRVVPLDAEEC